MERKIPIKTLYLLSVISFGLVFLGIGSTYAMFTTSAEITNPISITSNLSYTSDTIETVEVTVPSGEIVTTTLNITNSTTETLNYTTWYTSNSDDISAGVTSSSDIPTGTLTSGGTLSVSVDIKNSGNSTATVTIGMSSGGESIVLGSEMKEVPNFSFTAYAIYSEDDTSLTFYKTTDTISVGDTYKGKTVTAVYTGFETEIYEVVVPWEDYGATITNVSVEDEISPVSIANWFYEFKNCTSMDLSKLDTSTVKSMNSTFSYAGYNVTTFELIGLEDWNTSSVTEMDSTFYYTGYNANEWNIGDLSKWDTSSVKNMFQMFAYAGYSSTNEWILDLSTKEVILSDGTTYTAWDVSNVTNKTSFYGLNGAGTIITPTWVS